MITESYDKQTGIVAIVIAGTVTVDEYIEWTRTLTPEKVSSRKLKLMVNGVKADYSFRPVEFLKIDQWVSDLCTLFESVVIARIHMRPKETAISEIADKRAHPSNYLTRLFTSQESAEQWLLER
jgi:hypothetical protein